MNHIVVGVDGDRSCTAAVEWAVDEATRRGWSLVLLRALQYPGTVVAGTGGWYPEDLLQQMDAAATGQLEEARGAALQRAPHLDVTTRLVHLHPRLALTDAGRTARMVVTGAGRRGLRASPVLGSTSMHVAAHSACAVAVVRAAVPVGDVRVVVGHDGSSAADEAVAFAAEEAAGTRDELLVVRVWSASSLFPVGFDGTGYEARLEDEEVDQRRRLEQVASSTRDAHPGLRVRTQLLTGVSTCEGLLDAARSARLLVVGTRGHGAFASMLLGSTSQAVLHAAAVPVVVVPDRVHAVGSGPVALGSSPTAVPVPHPA